MSALTTWLTAIADAIRGKDGTALPIDHIDFPAKIAAIPQLDTSDATALVTDILAPKTAYIATGKVTGTCTYDADTSSGDAVAADLALGKKAWVDGAEVVGSSTFNATVTNGIKIAEFDGNMNPLKAEVIGDNVWLSAFMSAGPGNLSWDELTEVSAPDATALYESAFHSLPKLTALSLPNVQSITAYSIYQNTLLAALTLPELTTTGYYSIHGNNALTTLILPKCVTVGSTRPLGSNSALTSCQLGSIGYPVTSIISNAFYNMTQLGLTVTIYVTPGAQPLAGSPWGATNATIVYRSAVDGSVL